MDFWDHEYRINKRKPDIIYQNLMMCYDKTRYAVFKNYYGEEKTLLSCLHDFSFRIEVNQNMEFRSFFYNDTNESGLFAEKYFDGNFNKKYEYLLNLIHEGTPAFIETIHPLLPFSLHYNPDFDYSNYNRANHIFTILGKTEKEYIYFDTSSYKAERFIPYEKNKELGVVNFYEVDKVLRLFWEIYTIEPQKKYNHQYDKQLLNVFVQGYNSGIVDQKGRRSLEGKEALKVFFDFLLNYYPIDEHMPHRGEVLTMNEIILWRMKDIGSRRKIMSIWEAMRGEKGIAQLFEKSSMAWEKLTLYLQYSHRKRILEKSVFIDMAQTINKLEELLAYSIDRLINKC